MRSENLARSMPLSGLTVRYSKRAPSQQAPIMQPIPAMCDMNATWNRSQSHHPHNA